MKPKMRNIVEEARASLRRRPLDMSHKQHERAWPSPRGGAPAPAASIVPADYHLYQRSPLVRQFDGVDVDDLRYDAATKEWSAVLFPSAMPSSRAEVLYLQQALDKMLAILPEVETTPEFFRTLETDEAVEQHIASLKEYYRTWDIVFAELVRQVHVHCVERGVLLQRVREGCLTVLRSLSNMALECAARPELARTLVSAGFEAGTMDPHELGPSPRRAARRPSRPPEAPAVVDMEPADEPGATAAEVAQLEARVDELERDNWALNEEKITLQMMLKDAEDRAADAQYRLEKGIMDRGTVKLVTRRQLDEATLKRMARRERRRQRRDRRRIRKRQKELGVDEGEWETESEGSVSSLDDSEDEDLDDIHGAVYQDSEGHMHYFGADDESFVQLSRSSSIGNVKELLEHRVRQHILQEGDKIIDSEAMETLLEFVGNVEVATRVLVDEVAEGATTDSQQGVDAGEEPVDLTKAQQEFMMSLQAPLDADLVIGSEDGDEEEEEEEEEGESDEDREETVVAAPSPPTTPKPRTKERPLGRMFRPKTRGTRGRRLAAVGAEGAVGQGSQDAEAGAAKGDMDASQAPAGEVVADAMAARADVAEGEVVATVPRDAAEGDVPTTATASQDAEAGAAESEAPTTATAPRDAEADATESEAQTTAAPPQDAKADATESEAQTTAAPPQDDKADAAENEAPTPASLPQDATQVDASAAADSTDAAEAAAVDPTDAAEVAAAGSTDAAEVAAAGSTDAAEAPAADSTDAAEAAAVDSTDAAEAAAVDSTDAAAAAAADSTDAAEAAAADSTDVAEAPAADPTDAAEAAAVDPTDAAEAAAADSTDAAEVAAADSTDAPHDDPIVYDEVWGDVELGASSAGSVRPQTVGTHRSQQRLEAGLPPSMSQTRLLELTDRLRTAVRTVRLVGSMANMGAAGRETPAPPPPAPPPEMAAFGIQCDYYLQFRPLTDETASQTEGSYLTTSQAIASGDPLNLGPNHWKKIRSLTTNGILGMIGAATAPRPEPPLLPGSNRGFVAQNVQLAEVMSTTMKTAKPKSMVWLRKTMADIIISKMVADAIDDRTFHNRATMPEFLFEYLKEKYGTKALVDANVGNVVSTLQFYREDDLSVEVFAKFLQELWSEQILRQFLAAVSVIDRLGKERRSQKSFLYNGAHRIPLSRCWEIVAQVLGARSDAVEAAFRDKLLAARKEHEASKQGKKPSMIKRLTNRRPSMMSMSPRSRAAADAPVQKGAPPPDENDQPKPPQVETVPTWVFLDTFCREAAAQEAAFQQHLAGLFSQYWSKSHGCVGRARFGPLLVALGLPIDLSDDQIDAMWSACTPTRGVDGVQTASLDQVLAMCDYYPAVRHAFAPQFQGAEPDDDDSKTANSFMSKKEQRQFLAIVRERWLAVRPAYLMFAAEPQTDSQNEEGREFLSMLHESLENALGAGPSQGLQSMLIYRTLMSSLCQQLIHEAMPGIGRNQALQYDASRSRTDLLMLETLLHQITEVLGGGAAAASSGAGAQGSASRRTGARSAAARAGGSSQPVSQPQSPAKSTAQFLEVPTT